MEPLHIRCIIPGILRDRSPMQGPRRLCIGCSAEPAASLDDEFCIDCIDAAARAEDEEA